MPGRAVTDVLVSAVGGNSPRLIYGASVTCAWAISQVGSASVLIPYDQVRLAGISQWLGLWIKAPLADIDDWAGVITRPVETADGLELGCDGPASALRKRRLPANYSQQAAPAGALVLRAIADVDLPDAPLWLTSKVADEDGDPIATDARSADLLQYIQKMASDSDSEWRVTANRAFEFRRRIGRDLTASVELVEGRHVVAYTWPHGDLWSVTNDLQVIGKSTEGRATPMTTAEVGASIVTYGRLQDTITLLDETDAGALAARGRRIVSRLAQPAAAATITLVNVDRAFGWFTEGDTVTVTRGNAGKRQAFRVTSRALQDDGTLLCGGTVIGEAA